MAEGLARTKCPPTRPGPEGSNRNGFSLGRCPVSHPFSENQQKPTLFLRESGLLLLQLGQTHGILQPMTDVSDTPDIEDGSSAPEGAGLPGFDDIAPKTAASETYEVLARKYRPQDFSDLMGQEALVRTLSNAFTMNRIAHAFILTGVRGIGKTTTARIIARGLNCIGPDGNGGPTVEPCGVCSHCKSIAASSHVDVIEMDAASNTGIDDIREIIDAVRYTPSSARYKVYIIDEVHMLSKNAFNGLLKTLEEPPAHVKFIFATTEIRKVPITVLSRCQRFDLKRFDQAMLAEFLGKIAGKEGAAIAPEALQLLARAAEGSARDGLSLLDQAIAQRDDVDVEISVDVIRDMLGLADRARMVDLFDMIMTGDAKGALTEFSAQYDQGADPLVLLQDLANLCHFVTRLKVVGEGIATDEPEEERIKGLALAEKLSMPVLTRTWQILLKGIAEVQSAPDARAAGEMVIIRLCYAAELPAPGDLVKRLTDGANISAGNSAPTNGGNGGGNGGNTSASDGRTPLRAVAGSAHPQAAQSQPDADAQRRTATAEAPQLDSFEAIVALMRKADVETGYALEKYVRPKKVEPGVLDIFVDDGAPNGLTGQLSRLLKQSTGMAWKIVISRPDDMPDYADQQMTIRETRDQERADILQNIRDIPLVKSILDAFPDAELGYRSLADLLPAADDMPPVMDDDDNLMYDPDDGFTGDFDS